MDRSPYLIIGGSTKCGTTSLFSYFEFHPDVCACTMKESRYFLEPGYKLIAQKRDHSGIDSFSELFPNCPDNKLRLEATPDYLYSSIALNRIHNELTNAKMVFILRKPIGRLVSWFKFARQLGLIDEKMKLDDFVEMQQSSPDAPQHLRSLEQGRYSDYLQKAYAILGSERIMICFYEDLEKAPEALCKSIADFAGVDPNYFSGYEFKVYNASSQGKASKPTRLFRKFKRWVKPVKQRLPLQVRKKLKLASFRLEGMLSKGMGIQKQTLEMNQPTIEHIQQYYAMESEKIKAITGLTPPWD